MTCGGGGGDDDDDDGVGGGAEGDGAGSTSRSPKNPPLAPRRWVGRGGARRRMRRVGAPSGAAARGRSEPRGTRERAHGCRSPGRDGGDGGGEWGRGGALSASRQLCRSSDPSHRSWRQNPPLRWLRWHTLLAPTPPGRKTTRRAGPVRCPRRARSRRTAVRSSRRSRRARLASGAVASEEPGPVATANRASETIPGRTGRPSSRWAAPIGWR